MIAIEVFFTVVMAAALLRSYDFAGHFARQKRAVGGDLSPDEKNLVDDDLWYWRLHTLMVSILLAIGVVALYYGEPPVPRPPDPGENAIRALFLVFSVVLLVKGEVKATFFRKRNPQAES